MSRVYACESCGRQNCKLWREYMTLHIELLCSVCLAAEEKIDASLIDARGTVPRRHPIFPDERTHCIGETYIPAIPVQGESAFWGYGAIPAEDLALWEALPTCIILPGRRVRCTDGYEGLVGAIYTRLGVIALPGPPKTDFSYTVRGISHRGTGILLEGIVCTTGGDGLEIPWPASIFEPEAT